MRINDTGSLEFLRSQILAAVEEGEDISGWRIYRGRKDEKTFWGNFVVKGDEEFSEGDFIADAKVLLGDRKRIDITDILREFLEKFVSLEENLVFISEEDGSGKIFLETFHDSLPTQMWEEFLNEQSNSQTGVVLVNDDNFKD